MLLLLKNKMQLEQGQENEQYVNGAFKDNAFHSYKVNAMCCGRLRGMEVLLGNQVDILNMRPNLLWNLQHAEKRSFYIWSGRNKTSSG
jgi:hypothetical protein